MNSLKPLIFLFLFTFIGLMLLSGFCLAAQNHSCCPSEKAVKCPMPSVQKAASPKEVKALKSPALRSKPISKPVKETPVAPAAHKHSAVPEFRPPNCYLFASVAHQTNAPPQA